MPPASRAGTDSQPFDAAFARLTGHSPFRWQRRLFDQWFSRGVVPDACDVPTGLGKTATMAVWLIAQAGGATLPRRLVYVVDRRAVVDQATRFAQQLRSNLPPRFAAKLELGDQGLPISTLRGGFADNREWLEDPSRLAVVVGTIDLVGSRLLFEGYGVSRRMRPYHAGLLGADTLVVLDEAHLCPPFEALLRGIAEHRDVTFGPTARDARVDAATPPFRLMSLSATGRKPPAAGASTTPHRIFRLQDGERDERIVRQRLTACKRLKLIEIDDSKSLPNELARRAVELGFGDAPARVVVYCNSRQDALAVKDRIDGETKAKAKTALETGGSVSELLVGERRVHERATLENWLEQHGFLGGGASPAETPTFLVATSAGEVGVDLDADHMVCDLVAWERMVQRLGRVNRRGGAARSAVIDVFISPPPRLKATNASAAARAQHEQDLASFNARIAVLKKLQGAEDGRYDASPQATTHVRSRHPDAVELATTPAPLYPALTRPHLEAWAMTSLRKHPGRTEVAPWLRGWEEQDEPHTNVVWRTYLPCLRVGSDLTAPAALVTPFFQSAPVHATEKLEALRSHVSSWLLERVRRVSRRPPEHDLAVRRDEIVAVVIDHAGDFVAAASLDDLLFLAQSRNRLSNAARRRQTRHKADWERSLGGATLVVSASLCGLVNGMLDEKSDAKVATADGDEEWQRLRQDADSHRPLIRFRVLRLNPTLDEEGLVEADYGEWRRTRTFETDFDDSGGIRSGLAVFTWPDDPADEDSRSIRSIPQTLRDHTEQVATRVREMAARLELPDVDVDALERAARLHDAGKSAPRWQAAMNAPQDGCGPYAKTRGGGNWRLLEGYRHEFGSVLKAERATLPAATRDLILHLIAAHHGNSRPLISIAGCEDGPPSLIEAKAGETALRYARLQRSYGVWGLAWREAILRAADQSASRDSSSASTCRSSDG